MIEGKLTKVYKEAFTDEKIRNFLRFAHENKDVLNFLIKHHKDIFPYPPEHELLNQIPFFPILSWSNNLNEFRDQKNDEIIEDTEDEEEEVNEISQIVFDSIEDEMVTIRTIAMYSIIMTIKEDNRLKELVKDESIDDFKKFRQKLGSIVKESLFEKFEKPVEKLESKEKRRIEINNENTLETYFEYKFKKMAVSVINELSKNLSIILMIIGAIGLLPILLSYFTHKWYVKSVINGIIDEKIIDILKKLEENDFILRNVSNFFCVNCFNKSIENREEEQERDFDKSIFYANVPPDIPLDYSIGNCPFCGGELTRNTIWTLDPDLIDLFTSNDGFISYYIAFLLEKEEITWEASIPTNRETDFYINIGTKEMILECKKFQMNERQNYSTRIKEAEKQLRSNMEFLKISKGRIVVNLRELVSYSDYIVYAGDIDVIKDFFSLDHQVERRNHQSPDNEKKNEI